MHGFGLSLRIREMSRNVFQVEMGSFYPALCRLEARGLIRGAWGVSEANRKARYYWLTPAGRGRLQDEKAKWEVLSGAINLMLKETWNPAMGWLRQFIFRLRAVFMKKDVEAELADEVQAHLDMAAETHIAAGMSQEDARYAARREFGGVEQVKERYRDERSFVGMDQLAGDMRLAVRSLLRARGFSLTVLLIVALCLGANVVISRSSTAPCSGRCRFAIPAAWSRCITAIPRREWGGRACRSPII